MSKNKNWNCDGSHCTEPNGIVKLYPLGGGGNMIYCQACFRYENQYRLERGLETGEPDNFPIINWNTAKEYKTDEKEETD